jgi:hypothetical protein
MAHTYTGPHGRPQSPGEAQLWWDIQDIIGSANLWPHMVRGLFWQHNLNYMQRQIISAFVFVNGLNPSIFLQWIQLRGLARDRQAQNHFA